MIDRRALLGIAALFGSMWPFRAPAAPPEVPASAPLPDKSKVTYTIEYDTYAGAVSKVGVVNRGTIERYAKLSDLEDVVRLVLAEKSKNGQTYFVIEVPSDWAQDGVVVPVTLSKTNRFLSSTRGALHAFDGGQMTEENWTNYMAERPEVGPVDMTAVFARRDAEYRRREAEWRKEREITHDRQTAAR